MVPTNTAGLAKVKPGADLARPMVKPDVRGPKKFKYLRKPGGPYQGAKPGIGKKKRPSFEQQMGPRPMPSGPGPY